MNLDSKSVIVTGSSNNIGRAIAIKFARNGANVVVHAKSNVAGGRSVCDEISQLGANAIFVQADLADEQAVRELFERSIERFGKVDVLINNAGRFEEGRFADTTRAHWNRMFEDNFYSAVNCCTEAGRVMNDGGKIINIASIRGLERGGRPGGIAYSAAKAALISFTKTLAQELAPAIHVNAVAPGFTKTSAFDKTPPSRIEAFLETTILKRWLEPEEVADGCFYLATADGITGEVLVIDAGWNAR